MLELTKEFFNKFGWKYSQIKDESVLFFGLNTPNGKIQCFSKIIEQDYKFAFYSISNTNCPEDKKRDVSELITRLNNSRFLGNFEMNYEDGQISYKTSIYYKDINPTLDLIETLVVINISSMDIALPAFTGVIFGDVSPEEAVNIIDKKVNASIKAVE